MNQSQTSTHTPKRIACVCPLSPNASTVVGRLIPLTQAWQNKLGHTVQLFLLQPRHAAQSPSANVTLTGKEPFTRTKQGKIRLTGIPLIINMFLTALHTTIALTHFKPNIVIIAKPLPTNVFAVYLWSLITRFRSKPTRIILDVDDFELTANHLSSLLQRFAIHWSERTASQLADYIIVSSPFLQDHFQQLTNYHKPCEIIVTGLNVTSISQTQLTAIPENRIAYLGSLSISSGHRVDLLPEILKQIKQQQPNIKLLLAGDGDDTASLIQQFNAKGLSNQLILHGRFKLSELSQLLTSTTILIDPIDSSIVNRAKSSFRCALATTLGLACVTSDIGVRSFLIPTNLHDRVFARPNDPKAYAKKIIELLNNPLTQTERNTLQQHANVFDWQLLANQYIS